jgi:hypothetical protein
MRKRVIISVIGAAMLFTACGNAETENKVTKAVEKETTVEMSTEEQETEAPATEGTLTDYLADYRDSATYHLLNDIALNEDAVTEEDRVTYTFETGKDGKRELGYVSAHYKKVLGDTTYPMSFCRSFIQMELPELSEAYKNVVIGAGMGEYLQEMTFKDYKIMLIPNEELTEMTVKIEPVK